VAAVSSILVDMRVRDFAWDSIAVAVNREYARLDTVLREGDEVALLPPVSGGSYTDGAGAASNGLMAEIAGVKA